MAKNFRKVRVSSRLQGTGKRISGPAVLARIIEERMHGLLENHLKAETYVSRLADTRHRKLIEMYYLSEKKTTWEKVADDMGYSIREVYNIHGNALTELEKIMEESA